MLAALVALPFLAGTAAIFIYRHTLRRLLLVGTALAQCILVALCWLTLPPPQWGVLALDAPGLLVLTATAVLFLAASCYAVGYFHREGEHDHAAFRARLHFANVPEAIFTACLLFFLGAATLVAVSQHLGLMWAAVEATTLASAPLIYFHRHQRSLEATWKYLIICSVGIALALLGNFLLNVAWQTSPHADIPMTMPTMLASAGKVNPQWFKAAFIFMFVGYGTKMGLAPMHTWLPDAHSEAPSLVSALLSGALLNCAFLGILRIHQLSVAAGFGAFSRELFVLFGLFSMVVAALFILGQTDFKRMLAYSSVEHMGILILGVGIGGMATFGSMLHLLCHSLTKAAMFLLAGNVLAAYHTQTITQVSGVLRTLPRTGPLWLAGFLALTGAPPFGLFTSEFTILRAMFGSAAWYVPVIYLVCLGLIFAGMATACLRMAHGTAKEGLPPQQEGLWSVAPSAVLLTGCLMLGLYQPPWISKLLHGAAATVAGQGQVSLIPFWPF